MDINSEIKEVLNFIIKEKPEQGKKLLKTINALKNSFEDSERVFKESLHYFVDNNEYDKIRKYSNIQESISDIIETINNYITSFSIEIEENMERKTNSINPDDSIYYNLDEINATYSKPIEFDFVGTIRKTNTWKELYTLICQNLHDINPSKFKTFVNNENFGKKQYWFIDSNEFKNSIPKEKKNYYKLIPGTDIYTYANLSAEKFIEQIKRLFDEYNIPYYHLKIKLKLDKNYKDATENKYTNQDESNSTDEEIFPVSIVKNKMKNCIYCDSRITSKLYNIKFISGKVQLLMYYCNNCNKYFIYYKTYDNFIRNRKDITFFTENNQKIIFEDSNIK